MKVVVVDYKLGNIHSIINMLKKIGVEAIYSNQVEEIQKADKLILPGVGAFDHGMENLNNSGLINILNEEVLNKKKPILGICLGMQLLLGASEEGKSKGLNWLKGHNIKFSFVSKKNNLRIPHMGWNVLKPSIKNHLIGEEENRFYFVHSYHAVCEDQTDIIATAHHGYDFPAVIGRENILGAQFHPEKSHKFGMQFLKNFIEGNKC